MSSTESYGGICPNCGYKRMMLRYGSEGTFCYDACPKCGFAYGNNKCDYEEIGEKLWETILLTERQTLQDLGFSIDRQGLYKWTESLLSPPKGEISSVFDWSDKKNLEKIKQILKLGVIKNG